MIDKLEEIIFPTNIIEEVSQSFLDYALSVITDRALPDVRDGLKPVHRRIIYTMYEEGLFNNKPYEKSAATVGNVMGRYHAHGDSSVYEAMVRLAQNFSLRYPLIDGHGAFGDIDGNSPAHMRYTEAKLSKIAEEMVRDINKDTVDWKLNFSESRKEPIVLPSRYPNLLVNGATGIAVGMACSFAPHNLYNVIDCVTAYIENPKITNKELFEILGGPDFPTGGIVINKDELLEGYTNGRGRIRIRSKYKIEQRAKKDLLIFTELPYMTKKTKIIEDIVNLCEKKEIEGISDVRDESDENIALVVEIAKGYDPHNIANILFSKTQLENTYSINHTCLVNGEPKVLSLKNLIKFYVDFQQEVLTRRINFDLQKILIRLNIVKGLIIALADIDNVIKIIKESNFYVEALETLIETYNLNNLQAKAILDMRLSGLTKLQVQELKEEELELNNKKIKLEAILADINLLNQLFIKEIKEIQIKYKKPRLTDITQIDIIKTKKSKPDIIIKPITIAIDKKYNIKVIEDKSFKNKKNTNDYIYIINTLTSNSLSIFLNNGKIYNINISELKDNSNLINLLNLDKEKIINVLSKTNNKYILFLTKKGIVKKSFIEEYNNIKRNGAIGIKLREDDEVVSICYINEEPVSILTKNGIIIKFKSQEISSTGRNTIGVNGIKLKDSDEAISITPIYEDKEYILIITKNGFVKKTKKEEYTIQKRNGVGLIGCKLNYQDQSINILSVNDNDNIIIYSNDTLIKIPCSNVPTVGRSTQGNHIVKTGNVNNIHII